MNHRSTLLAAGIAGFTGVALGAFGAHGLRDVLTERGSAKTWETAVHYHLLHAAALLALAAWQHAQPEAPEAVKWIGRAWVVGLVLFSGSLYGLALGGPRFLGPITPLGGLAFLLGWGGLAWSAWRKQDR